MISVLLLALSIVMPKLAHSGIVYKYRGCHKDDTNNRDLPEAKGHPKTYDECASECADYNFFGQQWFKECFCGNEMGKHGPADDSDNCNCDKNAAFHGNNVNCVYEKVVLPDPPAITGVDNALSGVIPESTALDISYDMIRQPSVDRNTCVNKSDEVDNTQQNLSMEECKQFARRRDQLPIGYTYFLNTNFEHMLTVLDANDQEISGCFILCYPDKERQCRLMYNPVATGSDKAVDNERRHKLCKRTDSTDVTCTATEGYGGYYHCCTEATKCDPGQGDCDNDDQCAGEGFCGTECGDGFRSDQDCCKLCDGVDDCCTEANPCSAGSGKCSLDAHCRGRAWCDNAGFCRDCSDGASDCCENAYYAALVNDGCPEGHGGCTDDIHCEGDLVCGRFGQANCGAFMYLAGTTFTEQHKCCQRKECTGSDYKCCADKQGGCSYGEGDCDNDAECNEPGALEELVCGRDNCQSKFGNVPGATWRPDEDCCIFVDERYIDRSYGVCAAPKMLSYEECDGEASTTNQEELNRKSEGRPFGCFKAVAENGEEEFFWGNNENSIVNCSDQHKCRCHA